MCMIFIKNAYIRWLQGMKYLNTWEERKFMELKLNQKFICNIKKTNQEDFAEEKLYSDACSIRYENVSWN